MSDWESPDFFDWLESHDKEREIKEYIRYELRERSGVDRDAFILSRMNASWTVVEMAKRPKFKR